MLSNPKRSRPPRGKPFGSPLRFTRRMDSSNSEHYDRKLEEILRKAAAVFCARGYHQASIRDISRATGVSLAGLYYYFPSKEQLLYRIQRHAFQHILLEAREALEPLTCPEERLLAFIRLHLQFFLEHPNEMKVLTREEESLGENHSRDLRAIKKAYYKLCFNQVEAMRRRRRLRTLNTRVAVLSLFGMMNWIYTWYNPGVDPGAAKLAEQMTQIFLTGIYGSADARISRRSRYTKLQEDKRWQPLQPFPQQAR